MDAAGIDVQVLSHTAPSLQKLSSGAVELARRVNDRLAKIVATQPKRYAAFAVLPTANPAAAADELARCVEKLGFKGAMIHGLAHGQFVDDPRFWPIFARAAALDVPIYLHPAMPHEAVIDTYYKEYAKDFPILLRAFFHHDQRLLRRSGTAAARAGNGHRSHSVRGRLPVRGKRAGAGMARARAAVRRGQGQDREREREAPAADVSCLTLL